MSAPSNRALECWAGALALGTGSIHVTLIPAHLEEWVGYGVFFAVAGVAQAVLGLALLTDAVNPKETPNWRRVKMIFLWMGIVGNGVLIVLYVVSRTAGIPWVGPEAGAREAVAAIDVVDKAAEAAVVILLGIVLHRLQRLTPSR